MGSYTVHSLGDVKAIEVSHGDDRTMEAVRLAVMMFLADPSCSVVVDLSPLAVSTEPIRPWALRDLGPLAWHWPATPVVLACPSPQVRAALRQLPQGERLNVTTSLQEALSILTGRSEQVAVELRLAPHPTAPRAARDFVSRTFLDWGMARSIPTACLVVSELVTNAMVHARTHLTVHVSSADRRLRLAVRDASSDRPRLQRPHPGRTQGRGLQIVDSLSRAWGVLPTRDGGKVVWAVCDQ